MSKINDGQLDHSNRRISELELLHRVLQGVCARRMELLKRMMYSAVGVDMQGRVDCRITTQLWEEISAEIDDNEVQP